MTNAVPLTGSRPLTCSGSLDRGESYFSHHGEVNTYIFINVSLLKLRKPARLLVCSSARVNRDQFKVELCCDTSESKWGQNNAREQLTRNATLVFRHLHARYEYIHYSPESISKYRRLLTRVRNVRSRRRHEEESQARQSDASYEQQCFLFQTPRSRTTTCFLLS